MVPVIVNSHTVIMEGLVVSDILINNMLREAEKKSDRVVEPYLVFLFTLHLTQYIKLIAFESSGP